MRFWEQRRDARRRRAIKRQLRKHGVRIPVGIAGDLHALRKHRRNAMPKIPDFLSHLSVWCNLPVPFAVQWFDGVPDFRVMDHEKTRQCVMERLCEICGRRLGEFSWFVGGPKSLEESFLFMDPPMHEHCARYAIETCPFLNGNKTHPNLTRPLLPNVITCPMVSPERPEKIGMRRAVKYELVNVQGHALIHVKRWRGKSIWLA